jgi:transposase, IS6 family
MRTNRSALFRGRHFAEEIIVLCVRWYLRFSLSYRDLEELMMERGLRVDHTTVWRWVQGARLRLRSRTQPAGPAGIETDRHVVASR